MTLHASVTVESFHLNIIFLFIMTHLVLIYETQFSVVLMIPIPAPAYRFSINIDKTSKDMEWNKSKKSVCIEVILTTD